MPWVRDGERTAPGAGFADRGWRGIAGGAAVERRWSRLCAAPARAAKAAWPL
ncbi:hypothetical protein GLE_1440 [Lysobacter enzymogenes]|uniref:Uncharacterized protein n=1 Tax=Lysobacter enzymogenes TaxID=69 RepID=A0A0S2DEN9_LYSEN|nr:hypothetical protein GLE_1440 [Lysobacter enzymogenes]